jgi:hypothetical protein
MSRGIPWPIKASCTISRVVNNMNWRAFRSVFAVSLLIPAFKLSHMTKAEQSWMIRAVSIVIPMLLSAVVTTKQYVHTRRVFKVRAFTILPIVVQIVW